MTAGLAGQPTIRILSGAEELATAAVAEVLRTLGSALDGGSRAAWVLPGGSTPRRLFERLAGQPGALDWGRVDLFWSDERCVAPSSPASNFALARDTMLARLPFSAEAVHRVRGELPPAEAADAYATEVAAALDRGPFDLVLLGLGADGHTASLFPGPGSNPEGLAAAVEAPVEPRPRVTLTPRALSCSCRMVFLVSGPDKAPAVARALDPERRGDLVTHRLLPRGEALWLLDRQAAAELAGLGTR